MRARLDKSIPAILDFQDELAIAKLYDPCQQLVNLLDAWGIHHLVTRSWIP
jgi:hypothetical protein